MATFQYAFTVDEVRQSSHNPDRIQEDQWMPGKSLGSNVLAPQRGTHNSRVYLFNGEEVISRQETDKAAFVAAMRSDSNHRAATIYFCQSGFVCVDYDATTQIVGDGLDHPSHQMQTDGTTWDVNWISWSGLTFQWPEAPPGQPVGDSRVGINIGPNYNLYCHRVGSDWPAKLLPDRYFAYPGYRAILPQDPGLPIGALGGDLTILIGLLAMTTAPEGSQVHETLMQCIRRPPWTVPDRTTGEGRQFKRGVLVRLIPFASSYDQLTTYEATQLFFK